ncbi:sulfatase family protein [Carboxylicivirga marina]|uniref:Sulfatase-like hydrolase/transferase n=1 Tax=Carboxylicivirga marina TaxID=2800988 RepID=A0ABS1HKM1_9BACT|nr:sulfatase-like hydrolase/transferase [Carboxylicivirga marina]MBK3518215.1 sulfatase-like hydrolase/transferase [Carboxylicivirga marina]
MMRNSYLFTFLIAVLLLNIGEVLAKKGPNILFIECDDLMPRFMNKCGDGFGITPNLDQLASDGVYFKNSVCQAPMCAPSRNGLLTNLYPHELGFYRNGHRKLLPEDVWTFPQVLQEHGYTTAYIGKTHMRPKSFKQSKEEALLSYGFDYAKATGERYQLWKKLNLKKPYGKQDVFIQFLKDEGKYEQFLDDNKQGGWSWYSHSTMDDDVHYLDGYTTMVGENWLETQKDAEKPFFLWFNFCLPHDPYDAPTQYQQAAKAIDIPAAKTNSFGHEVPELLTKYSHGKLPNAENLARRREGEVANVMFMDKMIGNLVEQLKESGLYDNTVIVFFSDHSIFLGNHGIDGKGSLFEESLLASLIISYPKHFQRDVVSDMPVELMDLVPTAFEIAGIKKPEKTAQNGKSIVPVLSGKIESVRKYAISEIWQAQAVSGSRFRLIVTELGHEFLYDHDTDPYEMDNVAEQHPEVVKEMKDYLEQWKVSTGEFVKPNTY